MFTLELDGEIHNLKAQISSPQNKDKSNDLEVQRLAREPAEREVVIKELNMSLEEKIKQSEDWHASRVSELKVSTRIRAI